MTQAQTVLLEVKQYHGRVKNYINGQWVDSTTKEWLDVTNPATGGVIAEVPLSTEEEVRQAVQAAHEAFKSGRDVPPPDRTQYLFAFKHLLEEHKEELARIVTQENGKSIVDARGEVQRAIQNVEVATGAGSLMMGYNLEDIARGIDEDCLRQPMGVFRAIVPFNFPAMVAQWFMPYAIACGNTYIVKPSELTTLTTLKFMAAFDALPPGVIQCVSGTGPVGKALVESTDTHMIAFTGGVETGHIVAQACARQFKPNLIEASGNDPFIVMPSAPLDIAVRGALFAANINCGQVCTSAERFFVNQDIHDDFVAKLVVEVGKLRIGNGLDKVDLGPMVTEAGRARYEGVLARAIDQGAKVACGGGRPAGARDRGG